MYNSNEQKNITLLGRKPPTIFHVIQFQIRRTRQISYWTITTPRINHIRRYEKNITHDDYQLSTKPIQQKRLEIMGRKGDF